MKFVKTILSLAVLLSALFLSACSILEQITPANNGDEDVVIHQLIDTLYEDEDFRAFHSSTENMNIIAQFYNTLNNHDDLLFLGISDQYLFAEDIKVIEDASEKSEYVGGHWMVPSLFLNQNAFHFFDLKVQAGTPFDWSAINLDDDVLPAIMGANYTDLYQLGDEIEVLFFIRPITIKIIGFLDTNHRAMAYNDESFYEIDSYIILPMVEQLPPFDGLEGEELFHYAITSFAMINGYIAEPRQREDIDKILNDIGDDVGFRHFDLFAVPIDEV